MAKKFKSLNFAAVVEDFAIRQAPELMRAVVLDATQETINIANQTVAKGGKMRVDTGFLRASGAVSFDTLPSGPTRGLGRKDKDDKSLIYNAPESYTSTLVGFQLGQKIYYGWSADYAEVREMYDGFLDNAAQQWQQTVDKSVAKARKARG